MNTKIDFLYLSEPQMIEAGVTDAAKCVETMEEVLKLLNKGDYVMGGANHNSHGVMVTFPEKPEFPDMPHHGPDRRFMAMPAYIGGSIHKAGMKWYGSNAENKKLGLPRSILMVMLNDKNTGAPTALMSGNLISAYRTGAIPAVGVKHLARKGSKVLGIVGPGVMNRTATASFAAVCPTLDTIKVKGRGKQSLDSYIQFIRENCPQFKNIVIVDTIEEAVRDSDVVSLATPSPVSINDYPFIDEKWIKKGALLCLPASAQFNEKFVTSGACKLVVDNLKLYEAWAEEYPYPRMQHTTIYGSQMLDWVYAGKMEKERIVNIGAILDGEAEGRKSEDEIILYSVGGMPVEDVAWGQAVYENAVKMGIGTKLNLWDTPFLA